MSIYDMMGGLGMCGGLGGLGSQQYQGNLSDPHYRYPCDPDYQQYLEVMMKAQQAANNSAKAPKKADDGFKGNTYEGEFRRGELKEFMSEWKGEIKQIEGKSG